MSKYWAWGIKGTILEEKKKGKEVKFLDPWNSLLPDFAKKQLIPDIVATFNSSSFEMAKFDHISEKKLPLWALLYPKRSYVPPEYPHLQLWFLANYFAPSLSFVKEDQKKLMVKIADNIDNTFNCLSEGMAKLSQCRRVIVINATPFSFIKNADGRFSGGGQSVRTFHMHFLMMPKNLKKVSIDPEKAPLVYPTTFSTALFSLLFGSKKIQKLIFGPDRGKMKITNRGVNFNWKGKLADLVPVLNRIDQIFYKLQLSLIYSFYQDSENFLNLLTDFMATDSLEKLKENRKKLVLLGKEREPEERKTLLREELLKLGKSYGVNFSERKIKKINNLLTLSNSGDLASFVGKQVVVLRPGMGYGCLVEEIKRGFKIQITPLDSLFPEGTMESTGHIFTEKIKVHRKGKWLAKFLHCLEQSIGAEAGLNQG